MAVARIRDYSFKPKWNRGLVKGAGAKEGRRLLGVELEVVFEDVPSSDDALGHIGRWAGARGDGEGKLAEIVVKHDGSLPGGGEDGDRDTGFEVVFHPAHFEALKGRLQKVGRALNEAGAYDAHGDAGLHVHIARRGLSLGAQGAFLVFWNHLRHTELVKLAGRGDGEYTKKQDRALETPFQALMDETGHYFRVDAGRPETLEVRVFASTLKLPALLGRVQMVDAVAAYCATHPLTPRLATQAWREVYTLSAFMEWVKSLGWKYEEFRNYAESLGY